MVLVVIMDTEKKREGDELWATESRVLLHPSLPCPVCPSGAPLESGPRRSGPLHCNGQSSLKARGERFRLSPFHSSVQSFSISICSVGMTQATIMIHLPAVSVAGGNSLICFRYGRRVSRLQDPLWLPRGSIVECCSTVITLGERERNCCVRQTKVAAYLTHIPFSVSTAGFETYLPKRWGKLQARPVLRVATKRRGRLGTRQIKSIQIGSS